MSETLDMGKKYQEYYNQILSGTLSDTIIKSISYQANIKLANDVIAENEKVIKDLQSKIDELKSELEKNKNNKNTEENNLIKILENTNKENSERITKLNNTISELNKFKTENEQIKNQVQHIDTFRNELIKSREETQIVRNEFDAAKINYEKQIEDLNEKISLLKNPKKKKKSVVAEGSELEQLTTEDTKDGGTF